MQSETDVMEQVPYEELGLWELVVAFGTMALVFAIFGALFYFFFWKLIRSQLQIPTELKLIRIALERIADNTERK